MPRWLPERFRPTRQGQIDNHIANATWLGGGMILSGLAGWLFRSPASDQDWVLLALKIFLALSTCWLLIAIGRYIWVRAHSANPTSDVQTGSARERPPVTPQTRPPFFDNLQVSERGFPMDLVLCGTPIANYASLRVLLCCFDASMKRGNVELSEWRGLTRGLYSTKPITSYTAGAAGVFWGEKAGGHEAEISPGMNYLVVRVIGPDGTEQKESFIVYHAVGPALRAEKLAQIQDRLKQLE